MTSTSLVAGPAQAGHQSVASKPGIGLTAGAGASPTCDAPGGGGDDFAALVELALGELEGGATEGGAAEAAGTTHASTDAVGPDAGAADAEASPLDAPVDAATLSVLMALATPVPQVMAVPEPGIAPQPDATGQGSAALAAVDGAVGTSVSVAESAFDGARPGTTAAAMTFQDTLAAATSTPETLAVAAPVTPSAAAPPAGPATAATATATATATVAVAGAGAPEVQPAAVAAAPAQSPVQTPVQNPAATAAPAPADQAAPPPATARASQHPLRQALAPIVAEPAPTPSTPPTATTVDATAPHLAAQVAPAAVAAGTTPAEPRTPAASQAASQAAARAEVLAAAPVAAYGYGAASDAGTTGDASSGGSQDGSAASRFRGVAARSDASVTGGAFTATTAALPEALASGALGPMTGLGPGSGSDAALRAVDLPAAARFGQTLSSLDPDVRNLQAMVRTVRLFTAGSGATEARLTLEPEHLGPVALTVRVDQGRVSAHFRAETAAAHRWIETHQQELRSGLREQGLEVKEVVVTTDPDGRRERQADPQPARPRPRRQTADSPRFEVLV